MHNHIPSRLVIPSSSRRSRERIEGSLFALLFLVIAALLGYRIWQLHPLYKNHEAIRASLTTVAEREGWLLSGIDIRTATDDSITLLYHDRRRGADAKTCWVIHLYDSSLAPCDAPR